MTHFFDGIAGVLTNVLGDDVEYIQQGQIPRIVPSVFRRQPTEDADASGHTVLVMAPTWKVMRNLVPDVKRGDHIRLKDGTIYEIANVQPTGSPASDAFIVCELYEAMP